MQTEKGGIIIGSLKGVGTALITTLIGIIVFGFIVKAATLGSSVISAVNQFLKVISLFLGCLFSAGNGRGLFKGLIIGALYTALVYLLFSLLFDGITFGGGFFIDLIFALVVGGLSGIITVNVKK